MRPSESSFARPQSDFPNVIQASEGLLKATDWTGLNKSEDMKGTQKADKTLANAAL